MVIYSRRTSLSAGGGDEGWWKKELDDFQLYLITFHPKPSIAHGNPLQLCFLLFFEREKRKKKSLEQSEKAAHVCLRLNPLPLHPVNHPTIGVVLVGGRPFTRTDQQRICCFPRAKESTLIYQVGEKNTARDVVVVVVVIFDFEKECRDFDFPAGIYIHLNPPRFKV